jgi:hypothetical protein
MPDPIRALALPSRRDQPRGYPDLTFPNGNGYGFHAGPPPEEASALWRLTRRYWKLLTACAVVSAGIAFLVGTLFGKPQWQAEAQLLYQPVALSEKQRTAYEHPPGLPTMAGWVKEPILLRQLIDEFQLGMSPDTLGEVCIKFDQPPGTEALIVDFKWPDADVARKALDRLLELYSQYVVATRKRDVLVRVEKLDQQLAAGCEDEMRRLSKRAKTLEETLRRTGVLGDDDLEGTMLARRNELQSDIRKQEQMRSDLKRDLENKERDLPETQNLVNKGAERQITLRALERDIEHLKAGIKDKDETIAADKEELRTLPLQLTRAKYNELRLKLEYLREELKRHAEARAQFDEPAGPPARGALEGMDAREFSVKQAARVGEKPASSNKNSLRFLTFLGLMGTAFGLLFVYDRRHPSAAADTLHARVVHVTPPPSGPELNGDPAHGHRLNARIHEWLRSENGAIVTPPPVTINPDGEVEGPPPPVEGVDPDSDHLAQRMQQWLGDGIGPK